MVNVFLLVALNLLRLSRITGNTEFEIKASLIGKYFSQSISNSPSAFTQFLCALDFAIGPSNEIVIVEGNNSKDEFVKKIREEFNPNKVINASIYTAISAGIDYKESIAALSEAERLSVAGKADLESTIRLLASTLNAYGASTPGIKQGFRQGACAPGR